MIRKISCGSISFFFAIKFVEGRNKFISSNYKIKIDRSLLNKFNNARLLKMEKIEENFDTGRLKAIKLIWSNGKFDRTVDKENYAQSVQIFEDV